MGGTLLTFKTRVGMALVALAGAVHMQLTSRAVQAVTCAGGRLRIQQSIECYHSAHTWVAIAGWMTLLFFSIGFPMGALWVLYSIRAKSKPEVRTVFAFLTRSLHEYAFWYRVFALMATQLLVVAVLAAVPDVNVRFLVSGALFCFDAFVVAVILPFKTWWNNLLAIGSALLAALESLVILSFSKFAVTDSGRGAARNALAAVFGVTVAAIVLAQCLKARAGRSARTAGAGDTGSKTPRSPEEG